MLAVRGFARPGARCFTTNYLWQETERLCVYLMDEALSQMHVEGRAQTVLTVFDLRGFGCVAVMPSSCARLHGLRQPFSGTRRSTSNADIPFIRFFIKCVALLCCHHDGS